MNMKYLILGNGAAGVTAAARLRELEGTAAVTIAASEDTTAYAKIMLPDYIGGKVPRAKLFIREKAFYEANRIQLLPGLKAVKVDTADRMVEFGNGRVEPYDKLLVAVGGIPFIPDIEGLADIPYFSINSLEDADRIKQSAERGGTALILGGGLTGIEMAYALGRLGMEVTLAERETCLLPVQLDSEASGIFIRELEREGIRVITGTSLQRVHKGREKGDGSAAGHLAEFSDGRTLEFNMLVVAIGTRSNTGLVKDTGIECRRGILVDKYLQSSAEGVFAAGDAAEAAAGASSEYVSCYVWSNAMAQGKCAASNMAGAGTEFAFGSAALNMTQLRDIPFISMGLVKPRESGYEVLTRAEPDKGVYRKLIIRDHVIKGMILLGDTSSASALSAMIRKETDVSDILHKLLENEPV